MTDGAKRLHGSRGEGAAHRTGRRRHLPTLAGGGDGYPNVSSRMTTRELMYEVLAEYVRTQSPITPIVQVRITCLDGNGPDAPNCPR